MRRRFLIPDAFVGDANPGPTFKASASLPFETQASRKLWSANASLSNLLKTQMERKLERMVSGEPLFPNPALTRGLAHLSTNGTCQLEKTERSLPRWAAVEDNADLSARRTP